jgi:hypothetical protein
MSHPSFTRSSSDNGALKKKDEESSRPFQYATDSNVVEAKDSCFVNSSPFMHNHFHSVPKDTIDIESDLRGQTRPLTKCVTDKYNPNTSNPVTTTVIECNDRGLIPQYTRMSQSPRLLSGISINRFDPLIEDLQDNRKIHNNSYAGINTRLQIKDAYKQQFKQSFDK